MTDQEAIAELRRRVYRTTCYGNKVLEHEENLVVIEALKKQIAKKPRKTGGIPVYICPTCICGTQSCVRHCIWCGQKLDWSDVD